MKNIVKVKQLTKMIISFIVAMGRNREISNKGKLPWHMPTDLKYYRDMTRGKTIIMGRKTLDSMKRPMPDRVNIVMTRDKNFKAEGCIIVHSVDEALKAAGNVDEVMVTGGADIFKLFFPKADRIYLTKIDGDFEADVFFPEFDIKEWKETSYEEHEKDAENPYDYVFVVLERVK